MLHIESSTFRLISTSVAPMELEKLARRCSRTRLTRNGSSFIWSLRSDPLPQHNCCSSLMSPPEFLCRLPAGHKPLSSSLAIVQWMNELREFLFSPFISGLISEFLLNKPISCYSILSHEDKVYSLIKCCIFTLYEFLRRLLFHTILLYGRWICLFPFGFLTSTSNLVAIV